ncbi:GNAT family N-acetyltransferase [Maricaulis sp.]|uniref:GNAT family N-acetyltransferase n=1 Tax=Maricaulis sp. TaxID=1486257 RepID=UPI00262324CE|nr:GNAT family N-acetyltransferase [Maricaulis sp.]
MIEIRPMAPGDADAVLRIYGEGIATGHATFESTTPSWPEFDAGKLAEPRLVAVDDGEILGWAALSSVSSRCVYGGVGEMSVYVAESARGRGVGRALLAGIVEASEAQGIWMLQAGIFPENTASIALHERYGFKRLGVLEGLGKMPHGPLAGHWRDVLQMARRSRVAGID